MTDQAPPTMAPPEGPVGKFLLLSYSVGAGEWVDHLSSFVAHGDDFDDLLLLVPPSQEIYGWQILDLDLGKIVGSSNPERDRDAPAMNYIQLQDIKAGNILSVMSYRRSDLLFFSYPVDLWEEIGLSDTIPKKPIGSRAATISLPDYEEKFSEDGLSVGFFDLNTSVLKLAAQNACVVPSVEYLEGYAMKVQEWRAEQSAKWSKAPPQDGEVVFEDPSVNLMSRLFNIQAQDPSQE